MTRRNFQAVAIATIALFNGIATARLEAATFHFIQGLQDGFASPTEPATPSVRLINRYSAFAPLQDYDEFFFVYDELFLETFDGLPMCITSASLSTNLRPSFQTADNDTFNLLFTDNSGGLVGPMWSSFIGNPSAANSLLPVAWVQTNFTGPTQFTLNLASLPNVSGTVSVLPTLQQLKYLDVLIQDDTNVDFLDLQLVTSLGGDVDGDGCVDVADLTLFAANFGNVIPSGVGDPNGDGVLNVQDLAIIHADFGKCCPEPSSLAYCAAAVLGMLVCGRRERKMVYIARVSLAAFAAYLASSVIGTASAQDYNVNAFVDAADFTVWSDAVGATVVPFTGADGDGSGTVDFPDYGIWSSNFSTSPLSPSQRGSVTLSVIDIGLDANNNRRWSVRVDPDDALFTNPIDSPDRGVGATVAAEVGFDVVQGTLVSVTKNATNFPWDNPGNSPFGFSSSPAFGVTAQGNQIFAALGSDFFGAFNYGASAGQPKEMLIITTFGSAKTKIMWSGVYGPNGDQGRLAQAGINFDVNGMAMAGVPEPSCLVLLAIGLCGFARFARGPRVASADPSTARLVKFGLILVSNGALLAGWRFRRSRIALKNQQLINA